MENLVSWTVYAPILGVAGLIIAGLVYSYIKKHSPGNEKMQEIGDAIHEGAMVFLQSEYKILAIFIAAVFLLLFWQISPMSAWAFLGGACCSMMAVNWAIWSTIWRWLSRRSDTSTCEHSVAVWSPTFWLDGSSLAGGCR